MSDYIQPRYYGLQEVLEAFDRKAKTPYWSLWDRSSPIDQNNDDDEQLSIDKLTYEINQSAKHNYTRPLILILHSKKEANYTKKSPQTAVICFISVDNRAVGNYHPVQPQYNPALESRISALENARDNDAIDDDDDDDDDDDNQLGSLNGITQLLEHPLVAGLLNKFITPSATPVQHLSGVDDDDNEIMNTINVLFSKGVKLEHLQKLASMPQSKIQMLISML